MKIETIKDNAYFKKIYKSGKSYVGAYIVLYVYEKSIKDNKSAFGFTVTKKVGNAVIRNRTRRLLKEVLRQNYSIVDNNFDYVIVARARASKSKFEEINKNFHYLFNMFRKDKR